MQAPNPTPQNTDNALALATCFRIARERAQSLHAQTQPTAALPTTDTAQSQDAPKPSEANSKP